MSGYIARSAYIGGADAAALLGKNPYQNVLKCWRKKVGLETDDVDNHHIRRGNHMESVIEDYCKANLDDRINSRAMFERFGKNGAIERLDAYEAAFETPIVLGPDGLPVLPDRPQITVLHDEYDFCGGHPDGLTPEAVWEFKAPAMRNMTRISKQGLNESWIMQVQYYMWITGLPLAKIAVWDYDLWRPLLVKIRANRGLHRAFNELCPVFWFHVETETEPNIPEWDECFNFRDDFFFDEICAEYVEALEAKYEATDTMTHQKAAILTYLQGTEMLTTEKFYVSAKEAKSFGTKYARLIVKPIEHAPKAIKAKLAREEAAKDAAK